jgi:hypothetical protein
VEHEAEEDLAQAEHDAEEERQFQLIMQSPAANGSLTGSSPTSDLPHLPETEEEEEQEL